MTWHPEMPDEYKNQIVTGDARELAKRIPDESIDLIYTDPPYPREFEHVWYEMGEYAPRILKPHGSLITLCSSYQIPLVMDALSGLDYHWLGWVVHSQKPTLFAYWICAGGKPILWFSKGWPKWPPKHGPYWDTKTGGKADKRYHKWGQHIGYAIKDIGTLVTTDQVVLDPFVGGGTTAAACKQLKRNYIAFEIDPEVAERARERVLNTQPPLFVMGPEQLDMEGI